MNPRTFLKECLMQFFIITTFVNVASAVVGPVLMPGLTFGFTAFWSPLFAGLLGTLPSVVLYSKKELTLRQTILRKVLHVLLLEFILLLVGWLNGNISSASSFVVFALMVLAVYAAVTLCAFLLESREAKQINAGLRALQSRK